MITERSQKEDYGGQTHKIASHQSSAVIVTIYKNARFGVESDFAIAIQVIGYVCSVVEENACDLAQVTDGTAFRAILQSWQVRHSSIITEAWAPVAVLTSSRASFVEEEECTSPLERTVIDFL